MYVNKEIRFDKTRNGHCLVYTSGNLVEFETMFTAC